MIYQPKPPSPQMTMSAPTMSALEQALGQKQKLDQIRQKYGQEMPMKKKPMPEMQWVGDNQG